MGIALTRLIKKQALPFTLIVLMAGNSQRFTAAGFVLPKALLRAGSVVILDQIIQEFKDASRIVIIASTEQEFFLTEWFKKSSFEDKDRLKFSFINKHNLGPSYSIFSAFQEIYEDQPHIVTYCDVLAVFNQNDFIEKLQTHKMGFVGIAGFHPYHLRQPKFGYVNCDAGNNVIDIKEKETFPEGDNFAWASAGVYGFHNGATLRELVGNQLKLNVKVYGEFYLSLAGLTHALLQNNSVFVQICSKFSSWGTPEELIDYNYFLKVFTTLEQEIEAKISIPGAVVLVAGGRSSRTAESYSLPKQLLRVSVDNNLLMFNSLNFVERDAHIVCVVSPIISRNLSPADVPEIASIEFINTELLTRNACETALIGLTKIDNLGEQVSVIATDNLIFFETLDEEVFKEADLIVWVASYYPVADHDPNQYSWVRLNDSGRIEEISIKYRPDNGEDWKMVVGNFTFKSKLLATDLISKVILEESGSSKELHLESVVTLALKRELYVSSHVVPLYFTIGSEMELALFHWYLPSFNLDA
jgi:NDP-sugar pyrophosphorylase family protein